MSVSPPKKLRPELPDGPFLVVGLARSGQAAARLLAGRGEEVVGVDSGDPKGAAGLWGRASKSSWIRMDWLSSMGRGPSSRARACPGRRR